MSNEMGLADQLAFSTVRVECVTNSGEESVGTAFFFSFPQGEGEAIPLLITNRHVISDATRGTFCLTEANSDGMPAVGTFTKIAIDGFEGYWKPHPDTDVDLCAMPIAPLLRAAERQGKRFFFRRLDPGLVATSDIMAELSALEEVVMVGYPVGIWDSRNNMPIFRKGITATRPDLDYEGRQEFMIDVACFPGSSGSPVLLFNVGGYSTKTGDTMIGETRIKLLGVLYAGPQFTVEGKIEVAPIPTKADGLAVSEIPTNLGMVIKAERILEFEDVFKITDQHPGEEPRGNEEPTEQ